MLCWEVLVCYDPGKKGTQALQRITSDAIWWIQQYKGSSINNLVCCELPGMLSCVCTVELQSRCSTPGRPSLQCHLILGISALTGGSYKKTTHSSFPVPNRERMFMWDLVGAQWDKGKATQMCNDWCRMGAASGIPIIITWLSLPCAKGEMQHNTGLKYACTPRPWLCQKVLI